MRKIKTVTLFPALCVILFAGLAVLLLGSAPAFAVKPAAGRADTAEPHQDPAVRTAAGRPGPEWGHRASPVATGTAIDLSICEFQTNILPPGTPVAGAHAGVLRRPGSGAIRWAAHVHTHGTPLPPLLPRPGGRRHPRHAHADDLLEQASRRERGQREGVHHVHRPDADLGRPAVAQHRCGAADRLAHTIPVDALDRPRANECWQAAQALVPPALMPAACNNNYGFLGPQSSTAAADLRCARSCRGAHPRR